MNHKDTTAPRKTGKRAAKTKTRGQVKLWFCELFIVLHVQLLL